MKWSKSVSLLLSVIVTTGPFADDKKFSLTTTDGLVANRVLAVAKTFDGRDGVHVREDPDAKGAGADRLVLLSGTDFTDGVIEVDMAGEPAKDAGRNARGFIGIAFRVSSDAPKFECIYLRPTNGRVDDPVRKSHAVQYESIPDFPWHKLRRATPDKYESGADIGPGEWTKVKIEVKGTKASLYIDGAEEASLVVNDLKLGEASGALWIGPGTDAYFSNLTIRD